MAVTLVLDQVTLPPMGTVALHLDFTFELTLSAETARRQAQCWLVDQVSYMIRAGEPTLVISTTVISTTETGQQTAVWRVPAILTATHLGDVGDVGHVDIDVETGSLADRAQCKAVILRNAKNLAAIMPPYTPRQDLPTEQLVLDVKPTRMRPTNNPLDMIPAKT